MCTTIGSTSTARGVLQKTAFAFCALSTFSGTHGVRVSSPRRSKVARSAGRNSKTGDSSVSDPASWKPTLQPYTPGEVFTAFANNDVESKSSDEVAFSPPPWVDEGNKYSHIGGNFSPPPGLPPPPGLFAPHDRDTTSFAVTQEPLLIDEADLVFPPGLGLEKDEGTPALHVAGEIPIVVPDEPVVTKTQEKSTRAKKKALPPVPVFRAPPPSIDAKTTGDTWSTFRAMSLEPSYVVPAVSSSSDGESTLEPSETDTLATFSRMTTPALPESHQTAQAPTLVQSASSSTTSPASRTYAQAVVAGTTGLSSPTGERSCRAGGVPSLTHLGPQSAAFPPLSSAAAAQKATSSPNTKAAKRFQKNLLAFEKKMHDLHYETAKGVVLEKRDKPSTRRG
ncbi:unnamed protein product [Amoebophrya sp. A120]|nr:unnamed protein product [Amoebophrya sp. A120]|eukprot:GSA120T00018896001.1